MSIKRTLAALAASLGIVLLPPATPCVDPPLSPPPVRIASIGASSWRISFENYTSFGAAGQFCACGLSVTGLSIQSVNAARVTNATNGTVLMSFTSNANTTSGFNAADSGVWHGFVSGLVTLPSGIPVDIEFDVTALSTATQNDVYAAIRRIGTDEADSSGNLLNAHQGISGPGPCLSCSGTVPTMGEWQLALLAVLLLTAGTLVVRRRTHALVLATGSGAVGSTPDSNRLPFDAMRFTMALTGVLSVGVVAILVSGEALTGADLTMGPLVLAATAYLLHLWTLPDRGRDQV